MQKIFTPLFKIIATKYIRNTLDRGDHELLKELIEVAEEDKNAFTTYHSRPISSSSIGTQSDKVANQKQFAIVIQGQIIKENDFTLETVKIYKKHFSDALIILSTWEDEPLAIIKRFEGLGITILLNEKPDYTGTSNINLQIVSSRNGMRKARELGAEYALKTRTDQRIYAPNVADYLYNITEVFPVRGGYNQKKRIVGMSLNTFKYRMYGLSDMLIYGHIDDMMLYWDVSLDQRVFTAEEAEESGSTLRKFAMWRVCEVYLTTEFLIKVGRTLGWSLKDSWEAFADHFCIVDKEQLDIFWAKPPRLEYKWLSYTGMVKFQEITFREWLNIYNNLARKEISETVLD